MRYQHVAGVLNVAPAECDTTLFNPNPAYRSSLGISPHLGFGFNTFTGSRLYLVPNNRGELSYRHDSFKGSGHYWYTQIIIIKPFLITSNSERLIV